MVGVGGKLYDDRISCLDTVDVFAKTSTAAWQQQINGVARRLTKSTTELGGAREQHIKQTRIHKSD